MNHHPNKPTFIVKCHTVLLSLVLIALSPMLSAQNVTRVACVGDSITAGAGVKDAKNRYPARLGVLLGAEYEVKNFGVSGATLLDAGDKPYKIQKAYQEALEFKPDIVVIKLGTNDSKPKNWEKKDDFAKDMQSLVEAFQKANPKVKVYLCHPVPVIGKGNFGIRNEIVQPEIIPLVDQVAKKMHLEVIDLYIALDGKPELFPDRVHPNDEGAGIIATTVHAAITKKQ